MQRRRSNFTLTDDDDLTRAIAEIDQLLKEGDRSAEDEIYLDKLTDAVEAYENIHYPIASPPDDVMLRSLMEYRGCNEDSLATATGIHVGDIQAILSGVRTVGEHGNVLAAFFHVHVTVFDSIESASTRQI